MLAKSAAKCSKCESIRMTMLLEETNIDNEKTFDPSSNDDKQYEFLAMVQTQQDSERVQQ